VSGHDADMTICALVAGESGAMNEAVAAQTRPPDTQADWEGPLAAGLRAALQTGADWLWVLDGTATPRSEALQALVDAVGRAGGLPPPALLASTVLDAEGRVADGRAALFRRAPTEPVMAAAGHRLLPVRAASGPILIRRDAVLEERGPRPRLPPAGALLEWTARVLRTREGYLVPHSECVEHRGHGVLHDPRTLAAVMTGRAFSPAERIRVALDLLQQAESGPRPGR
jgi:hypothetical protein